jgi:hypothetical protein
MYIPNIVNTIIRSIFSKHELLAAAVVVVMTTTMMIILRVIIALFDRKLNKCSVKCRVSVIYILKKKLQKRVFFVLPTAYNKVAEGCICVHEKQHPLYAAAQYC